MLLQHYAKIPGPVRVIFPFFGLHGNKLRARGILLGLFLLMGEVTSPMHP